MGEPADEGARLIRALALSQRFHLYIAHCASPRAADRWLAALAAELPELRGQPVRVVRLEPYGAQATDAPLTTELYDRVLVPLLAPPAELRGYGTIHIVDASRASAADDETWAQLFARWNEQRNLLQRRAGEVVVLLPTALALMFAIEAPDVWSIRSGEYHLSELAAAEERHREIAYDGGRGSTAGLDAWPRGSPPVPRRGGATARNKAPRPTGGSPRTTTRDAAELEQNLEIAPQSRRTRRSVLRGGAVAHEEAPGVPGSSRSAPPREAADLEREVARDRTTADAGPSTPRSWPGTAPLATSALGDYGDYGDDADDADVVDEFEADNADGDVVAFDEDDVSIRQAVRASPLERLAAWRLLPPLSLFGGDLEIAPWLSAVFQRRAAREISGPDPATPDDSRHRVLRAVEVAISDQRFGDARAKLAHLVAAPDADSRSPGRAARIEVAHALVLTASDDAELALPHALRALAHASQMTESERAYTISGLRGVAAFVTWCRGDLASAAAFGDAALAEIEARSAHDLQGLLLAMTRGDLRRAALFAERLAPLYSTISPHKTEFRRGPGRVHTRRVVAANLAFLGADVASARRDLDDATPYFDGHTLDEGTAILGRARPFAALLAAAHGDLAAADRVLRSAAAPSRRADPPPDANARRVAFHSYASGVIASERGERDDAWNWFDNARQAIAYWADKAFDRRALGRAHAATLVGACDVDDDPARALATACEAQAIADRLVGETGEDHIARVLAVLARRARRRLTTDPPLARALAREAADLIAPVRDDGAASWAALATQCTEDATSDGG